MLGVLMRNKTKIIACFGLFLLFFCYLSPPAKAAYGPVAFLTEYVSQDYNNDGTGKTPDVRRGYVQVSVPNPS